LSVRSTHDAVGPCLYSSVQRSDLGQWPTVTVVVPTRDRPGPLATCLTALARLDYPRDRLEVVVVDDGSASPAAASVPEGPRVRVVRHPTSAGPAAARNRGMAEAVHDLIAFTDDDCAPRADWLRRMAERHAVAPGHAIGGLTVNALGTNAYSEASQRVVSFLLGHLNGAGLDGRARPLPGTATFVTTSNLCVPADRLRELGGFDARFPLAAAEDRDFCDRWRARGWPLSYEPEAVVLHAHVLDLARFWRQHRDYGRGGRLLSARRRARGGEPLRPRPPGFYLGMIRHALGARPWSLAARVAALTVLSQVATARGFAEGLGPDPSARSPADPLDAPADDVRRAAAADGSGQRRA
jgi:GT2 family glycosyltransferase